MSIFTWVHILKSTRESRIKFYTNVLTINGEYITKGFAIIVTIENSQYNDMQYYITKPISVNLMRIHKETKIHTKYLRCLRN